MQLFSNDLGIDLGTSNVLISTDNAGIVVRAPSVVAVDKNSGRILQVGSAARNMLGRTPGNVVAMHPLKDGVVCDHEMTVKMLQELFRVAIKTSIFNPKPRVIISIPSGATEIEERTVINAAIEAGARRVYLIEEPLAAALGAGLDISGPEGHMIVDIGGGTTDIAVLTSNAIAKSSSIRIAGNTFDQAIIKHIRRKHGVVIGANTAEEIKIQIGCVYPQQESRSMVVKGRESKTGIPRELTVLSEDVFDALRRPMAQIMEELSAVLEDTSPELVGDLTKNGITLTGGCSQLAGMEQLLSEYTGVACRVADDPDSCVAYGCGKSLSWINQMSEGPINIAKRRILQEG